MSLLLSGGTVATSIDPVSIEHADVLIGGGHVVAVGAAVEVQRAEQAIKTSIDVSGCLLVPGNIDAHTHLYSTLARGMPYRLEAPRDFLQILQRIWWRLDRALDEESIRASVLVGGMEALLSGTTTLIDHHASPNAIDGSLDIVADALASLGIRSVCCYEVTDRDGVARARAGLEESRRFLEHVDSGAFPLARGMVGGHASFTLSPDTLSACADLARECSCGLHIHAAEDVIDEIDCERRYGVDVLQRLANVDALDERTLLAHGVHFGPDEADRFVEAGATLAHNPRSNMNNNVGRTPLARLGERVALGTDGIGADMFAESQTAFFRRRDDGASLLPSWPLARLSVGADVAGASFGEPLLGRIEEGAPADIVVLDYDTPTPLDADTFAGHWLYGLTSRDVRDVVVAGDVVVRDRQLTRVDQLEITAEAHQQVQGLWQRLDRIDVHPFDPLEV